MTDGNVMTPNPMEEQGQQAVAKNLSGGKGVPTQTPAEDADSDVVVIKVAGTRMEGNRVLVTLESSSTERLMSTDAKNLAYAQRFSFGMTNSGIEALGGLYVAPGEQEAATKQDRSIALWNREFKLTPGI